MSNTNEISKEINPESRSGPAPTMEEIAAWVANLHAIAKSIESQAAKPEAQSWLDTVLDAEEAAKWFGMCREKLLAAASGRNPKIVGFWINQRVVRFHPRSVLAKMAADAKVPLEVIAAAFGTPPDRTNKFSS